ncbi:MAG: hypothetical protein LBQ79_05930 [Deltaproteobacteria bacterium]|jgi:hypothetical protein|nr:hypothetical protein [Deltaproteobacteria bacterium]
MTKPPFAEIIVPVLAMAAFHSRVDPALMEGYVLRLTAEEDSESGALPEDPFGHRRPGGDPGGIYCRILWAFWFLEGSGLIKRSYMGTHFITPKGRTILASLLRSKDPGLTERYPGLLRFILTRRGTEGTPALEGDAPDTGKEGNPPYAGQGAAGSTGGSPVRETPDLAGIPPWEGAGTLSASDLLKPLLQAAAELSWDVRTDAADLLARSFRLAADAKAAALGLPSDPCDPELPANFARAASLLALDGLMEGSGKDGPPLRITDAGRTASLRENALDGLLAELGLSGKGADLPDPKVPGRTPESLRELRLAAEALRQLDLSKTAGRVLAMGRRAFRRLASELARAAAPRVSKRKRVLPFIDIAGRDGPKAAVKLSRFSAGMEAKGTCFWALFAAGASAPAVLKAIESASPRVKAADAVKVAELMHEFGTGALPLPPIVFRKLDRAFFRTIAVSEDAGTGKPGTGTPASGAGPAGDAGPDGDGGMPLGNAGPDGEAGGHPASRAPAGRAPRKRRGSADGPDFSRNPLFRLPADPMERKPAPPEGPNPAAGPLPVSGSAETAATAPGQADPPAGSPAGAPGDPLPRAKDYPGPEEFLLESLRRLNNVLARELAENVLKLGQESLLSLGRRIADAARAASSDRPDGSLGSWGGRIEGIFPKTCPNQHVLPVRATASEPVSLAEAERMAEGLVRSKAARGVMFAPMGLDPEAGAFVASLGGKIRCLDLEEMSGLMLRLGVGTVPFLKIKRAVANLDYLAGLEG